MNVCVYLRECTDKPICVHMCTYEYMYVSTCTCVRMYGCMYCMYQ
jgi:hypothetical protein